MTAAEGILNSCRQHYQVVHYLTPPLLPDVLSGYKHFTYVSIQPRVQLFINLTHHREHPHVHISISIRLYSPSGYSYTNTVFGGLIIETGSYS